MTSILYVPEFLDAPMLRKNVQFAIGMFQVQSLVVPKLRGYGWNQDQGRTDNVVACHLVQIEGITVCQSVIF